MSESSQRETRAFLATCPKGLEELLADELRTLGADVDKTTVAGVHFHGALEAAYRACLWSRLANRIVLCLLREEGVERPEELHRAVTDVDWSRHLRPGASLAVDFHGRSEQIRHTRFGAQTVKDGVVDALLAQGRPRPGVDLQRPDLRLYTHLHRGRLTLGVDLSGDSLHRRGYRRDVGHAPLKENLAAALLIRAGWPQRLRDGQALVDPLCGAGTLLIEAALMAADMAPNLNRVRFGFHGWAQHDEALWAELKREAEARASIGRKRCRNRLHGFDQSPPALAAAKSNAMRAGIPALIEFSGASLGQLTRPAELGEETRGLVMTNPPYGERLGELPELVSLYRELGEGVRRAFPGWRLAVFTANPDLGHRIGLRADKQYSLKNGPLEAKLLLMDVHAGSGEGEASAAATAAPRSEGAQMFANRLEKNRKRLRKWLKQSGETCYRLYDADMPEYALAVDVYDGRVHVQEYAPPRSVNAAQAQKRLFDALQVIPEVLDVDPGQVVIKRREKQSGRAQYRKQASTGERFQVREGRARLWVNLRDYLDTGLFLDHRPVRRMLAGMAPGTRFLNLFCYTAAATVQAALGSEEAGGASDSISVDLSNTYLEWARDNFALNGLDPAHHRVVRDDCLRWLETARAEFDLIFLDPPTFSNSKKMEGTLDVQRDHVRLVTLAMARLAAGGTLVFSNNQRRFQLDEGLAERFAVEDISARTFDPDFERRHDIHHVFLIRHREAS
ncbi:bifunctional 23S rRNA (guanine(2069)-N(7))-methyltransferase RlmK/23S rRNA (guanine(2445)-N(2))-methyltransferase RlmL [Billgrantia tianxiuensis]|jgi:23S rRNA (guanine2445-N2)-methyltransferase / 23S rRNA (guanine2069-N7)-methyltransferase|uniref:Ribosomal RNA large subunit methyltransferase K/L n=1 Tax=Billgrantia tianxiuensis TaxID=2497861 RepID=A0A6I6SQ10_9GAMM|nr:MULTISPECIES: bifunctional 23S rRNA (guanine(2069)-N(7))-methyltransferase RlmK/23S rRNA (guanine(2445)-N(2))-methyltransferase RlmL [Halomonas]MCE8032475.1 bifunctional 23S rRNA (guanine(2069)-N(7))-methyltransferase RlmK/23S rRNA (guanine(2445)-N(2))-methyltransferase RlmL [Halomonas sp. MCCC 1A11057]QHC49565.1 bifunctional 23S rRNA (guanine(2069)-N(7))-methyltransferase RlmK/23S rRNA (guanine(2445)-N(2))-methyltransferase RlmL [Halomonas tianxiuensis]